MHTFKLVCACRVIKVKTGIIAEIGFCKHCFYSITGGREKKWPVWGTAVLLLVLTMLAVGNSALQKLLLDPWKLCLCTVITGGVLPLLVWLTAAVRGRRAEK